MAKRRSSIIPFDIWMAQAPRSAADVAMFWDLLGALVRMKVDVEIDAADLARLAEREAAHGA